MLPVVSILNLNFDETTGGEVEATVWWLRSDGRVTSRFALTIPGGTSEFVPRVVVPDGVFRGGWVLVTADKPVLVGGRQEIRDHLYQMPFFPLDCSRPENLEWICVLHAGALEAGALEN
ncbi:MAG TPA: hypothetical protein VMT85_09820 [Thermoanaerobaculia bacterium]|nr:hypothetical protein [Thermoanaerobaculia bacterium]